MKNRKIITIFLILTIIFTLSGGTLAYLNWRSSNSQQTNVTFNLPANFADYIDVKGDAIFVGDLNISDSYLNGIHSTVTISKKEYLKDVNIYATLYLKINEIGNNIKNSSALKWVVTSGNSTSPGSILKQGNFYGKNKDDTISLLYYQEVTLEVQEYTIWIYLDANENPSSNLSGETLDVDVLTEIDLGAPSPNAPEIYDGLVPVIISNDGTVTVASTDDDNWYDYSNKKWANAVLVDNTSEIQESSYKNKNIGINKINNDLRTIADNSKDYNYYKTHVGGVISEDDILAYFVWIPRYKYRIWTTEVSATGNEQEIDIKFEEVTSISTGNSVGEYLTHPAFTFGNKQLSGIWVGKFETTEKTSSGGSSGSIYDNPTIKPNTSSLRSQNVANQFQTALKFSGGTLSSGNVTFTGNSTYGLSSSTDSHMMKNSEWGAVAYLSHSKYGINGEIRINNYLNNVILTGCGASSVNGGSTSSCEIAYGGATTYPQSTTGNISGIFDMSGGAMEYVMGNFNQEVGSSGFTTLPPSKYYDLYSGTQFTGNYASNIALCTIATCGGHALSETKGWYNDYANFVNSDNPWFARSGFYSRGAQSGAFLSEDVGGLGDGGIGFRVVLSS